jgi:hypothetical protein
MMCKYTWNDSKEGKVEEPTAQPAVPTIKSLEESLYSNPSSPPNYYSEPFPTDPGTLL